MRTLLLMRGAPGCGKSTWIKNHNLENYALSPDNIRILCSSLELMPTGEYVISQARDNESVVWEVLFKILEHRMSRGEFTIIDATCSKTKDILQYNKLADEYRYRMYILDFTKVPLETCLAQNKLRAKEKVVPEKSIRNIYARFSTQGIPSGVEPIDPNDFDTILERPIDLSSYNRIVLVGDIHGCYDTLMQYDDFKNGLKDDTEYIFLGDYIDRGSQNAEILEYLYSIKDKPNVCLLAGNHEKWLLSYGENVEAKSKEFLDNTQPELIAKNFDRKKARILYRKFRQFSHFLYNGLEILACHGGIPDLSTNLLYIPTDKFIKGVGTYEEYITNAETWMGKTKDNQFLIHGHRNTEDSEIQMADRVFNLEGRVEFGGKLRIVELLKNEGDNIFKTIELDDIQPVTTEYNIDKKNVGTVEEAIEYLGKNKFIQEKDLGNNISSYNFTREAFYKANWNKHTILARGLFIDKENKKIIARSYEKFFRINEMPDTDMENLSRKLRFPVNAYLKENGFLSIVSYDYNNDDLFVASKSTNKGDYVGYILKQLEPFKDNLLKYLRDMYSDDKSISLVFECEDIENDPHIIKYEKSSIVLLDGIYNTLDFKQISYDELTKLSATLGCEVKKKAFVINTWPEFRRFYEEIVDYGYKYNDKYIEGFVFQDLNGFMTKCKTGYYNFWKYMRIVADQTLRVGYITRTGSLDSYTANMFYGFLKELYKKDYDKENKSYPYKTDIISLREMFYKNSK